VIDTLEVLVALDLEILTALVRFLEEATPREEDFAFLLTLLRLETVFPEIFVDFGIVDTL
jgi:hypothetical protein